MKKNRIRAAHKPGIIASADTINFQLLELHARFCRVFADPKRLLILWFLQSSERSVGDIAEALELPLSNISQHLRVMRDRGAVKAQRDGRNIYYQIANPKFLKGATLIREGLTEELSNHNKLGNGGLNGNK